MARLHRSVSSLQRHLVASVERGIRERLYEICVQVVQENVQKKVYDSYTPQGDYPYQRTFELLNSVDISEVKVGSKYAEFEVYMNTDLINAYQTSENEWNQHADVYGLDMSQYIPKWIEEGTGGGLFPRGGSYYMSDSFVDLTDGRLGKSLGGHLRSEGWNVVSMG